MATKKSKLAEVQTGFWWSPPKQKPIYCGAELNYLRDDQGCGDKECCPEGGTIYAKIKTRCELKPGHEGRHEGPIYFTDHNIRVTWEDKNVKPKKA